MTNNKAIELLDNLLGVVEDNHGSDYDKAIHMAIDALKAADVVEVVRCKDCIYWCKLKEDNGVVVRIHHNELRSQCLNINGLNKTDCITEANDYCSYGERTEA